MKIYLSIPYTNCEEESFKLANKISAHLMNQGHIVFSPISMSHPIAMENDLPKGWEFWKQFDEAFVDWCDTMYVIVMATYGYKKIADSTGVKAEIEMASSQNKPVLYIKETDI